MHPPVSTRPAPTPAVAQASLDATVRAFHAAGATSPAAARPLDELPDVALPAVVALAARGMVRESAEGRFYVYPGTEHARREGRLTAALIVAVMLLVLVIVPLLLLQVTR